MTPPLADAPSGQALERRHQIIAVTAAFLSLFAIVGFALYGLPRFYPFFVAGARMDAAASHVGQRVQQDRRRDLRLASSPAVWSIDSARAA